MKNCHGFILTCKRRLEVGFAGKMEAPVILVAHALHFFFLLPFSVRSFQHEVPSWLNVEIPIIESEFQKTGIRESGKRRADPNRVPNRETAWKSCATFLIIAHN